jgi:glucan phosphoethanolaminetransferase (alkaline phosphatase superfamily)
MNTATASRSRLYALGALYCAPYLAMLVWCWHAYKPRSVLVLVLTAALGGLLLAGCTRTWRRFFLAYFPLLLLSLIYCGYALGFGVVPGHTLGIVLASASFEEMLGLWTVWQTKWLLAPVLGLLGAYLWLAWRLPEWPIFSGKSYLAARAILVLAIPVTVYAAHSPPQLVDGIALNPVVGSLMFCAGQLPRARAELRGTGIKKVPYHATRVASSEEVHVLIVGESARRGSMSVYGYQRATTPYLDGIKGEAIFLQQARADANLTSLAVPMILTGITPQRITSVRPQGSLLDLAKEAGYSTAWLLNQDVDVSTALGITADHMDIPPDPQSGFFGRRLPDGALLPAYRRELARTGTARFIGMHITESHWEYYRRYPPDFQRYGNPKKLNSMSLFFTGRTVEADLTDSYDNSVLYTDWFLQQVIEAARRLRVPATVTFVPDHGESLPALDAGFAGHGGPLYAASQFDIPAFVWVNDSYRAAHPEKVATMRRNAASEIRSHDFFYTVADLMGITWPEARPERSFASERFVPDATRQELVGGVLAMRP